MFTKAELNGMSEQHLRNIARVMGKNVLPLPRFPTKKLVEIIDNLQKEELETLNSQVHERSS